MKSFYAPLKGICFLMLVMYWGVGFGQSGQWTWMGGDSIGGVAGEYGVKGIASSTNKPGARHRSVSCTDKFGNFWLFGGEGISTPTSTNYYTLWLNDLWKYSPATKQWTWVSGDSIHGVSGIYGTAQIPSAANKPGVRVSATGWADTAGNIWIFGGIGKSATDSGGILNDLWRYNVATNEWAWMHGDSLPTSFGSIYGTQGVASSANHPGERFWSTAWTDLNGKLWLYGGRTVSGSQPYTAFYAYDDLWKFDPVTSQWTWVRGNKIPAPGLYSFNGYYNTKGVSIVGNKPPSKYGSYSWVDEQGNLWLYGGWGAGDGSSSNTPSGIENDLWRYNPITNIWTWINGSNAPNKPTVYGSLGTPSTSNTPGARLWGTSWADKSGNLWLSGGEAPYTSINDLWKYNISSDTWTWVSGDSVVGKPGIYDTVAVTSPQTKPGARKQFSSWIDTANNLWLFGGLGFDKNGIQNYLNDLWKFGSANILPLHLLTFTAKRANNTNLLNWTTAQEVNTDRFEIERSPNGREFSKIGSVKAGNTNYTFTDNDPLKAVNYYRLKMMDKDGQFEYSPIRMINNNGSFSVNIYPNPAKDKLQLQIDSDKKVALKMDIITQDGKVVLSSNTTAAAGSMLRSINIAALQSGTYFLRATSGQGEQNVVKFEKVQ